MCIWIANKDTQEIVCMNNKYGVEVVNKAFFWSISPRFSNKLKNMNFLWTGFFVNIQHIHLSAHKFQRNRLTETLCSSTRQTKYVYLLGMGDLKAEAFSDYCTPATYIAARVNGQG